MAHCKMPCKGCLGEYVPVINGAFAGYLVFIFGIHIQNAIEYLLPRSIGN